MILVNKVRGTGDYLNTVQEIKQKKSSRMTRSYNQKKEVKHEESDNIEYDFVDEPKLTKSKGIEQTHQDNEEAIKDMVKGSILDGDIAERILCIRAKNEDKYCKPWNHDLKSFDLHAKIQWQKRSNGLLPGPSFYPLKVVRKEDHLLRLLISYYEQKLTLRNDLIIDEKAVREDFW
mmetsp:Transcript_32821/g.29114  ORF Transcript_32821/g.29114 Transcript_32821/m.29114 type:complete len:176 (-) Transcript_32821:26-553(-)